MKIRTLIFLHLILFMYSCCSIFSKFAGLQDFLSIQFFIYYGIVLLILFVYALLWQKIIRLLPLTTAFANKAVTIVWGIIWGVTFFGENLTFGKILGAILIVLGIILYTRTTNLGKVKGNE